MSELAGKYHNLIAFIREYYSDQNPVPLHAPVFLGNEKFYLNNCIDTSFVSSVGEYVDQFEAMIREITGAKYAVATVNGTAALHIALRLAGVSQGDEVITQPLTFVATCNAIFYQGAEPVFIDVEKNTLGLCPEALEKFLVENTYKVSGMVFNRKTGRKVAAVLPMHSFGFPCNINKIKNICDDWGIVLVEDAAESLGSYFNGRHTGRFGLLGAISFNGNKIVTCGGGGCIITDDDELGIRAKHITTTARKKHQWDFFHDEIGFNYRMPNINAALGCAQLELLSDILANKWKTSQNYIAFCKRQGIRIQENYGDSRSNYWLNTILFNDIYERNLFLDTANNNGIQVRPAWTLMHKLPPFKHCAKDDLNNSIWLSERIVNLPSGFRKNTA